MAHKKPTFTQKLHVHSARCTQCILCLKCRNKKCAQTQCVMLFPPGLQAYLIGMIWACYKYVQQLVVARSMTREYQVDPDTEVGLWTAFT